MPKQIVFIKKLPTGSPAPSGYTYIRTTRSNDIYQKTEDLPVDTTTGMGNLARLFAGMTLDDGVAQIVAADQSSAAAIVKEIKNASDDELAAALSRMTMGGRRKTRKGKSKKSKKTRKH